MTTDLDPITAVTSQHPHATYDRLQEKGAFFWFAPRETWLATSTASIHAVLAHPHLGVRPPGEDVPLALAGTLAGDVFARLIRMTDGEGHRLGKVAIHWALDGIDLDRVRAESARQAEMIDLDDLSSAVFSLPVRVMGWLLGLPNERLARLPALVWDISRCIGPGASPITIAPGVAAVEELSSWFEDLKARTVFPALLNDLDEAFAGVGVHDRAAVVANAIGLLFQTHDATAGLLASTFLRISRSASVAGHPTDVEIDAIVRAVLDEDAPIQNTRRFARIDTILAGQHLRAGDPILVLLAAASGDGNANHRGELSLGFGLHVCPGGEVAIAIVASAVSTLLRRHLQEPLPGPVQFLESPNARIPMFNGTHVSCPVSHGRQVR